MAQIENRDWKYILENYDTPQTFFYLDPPYVHSTRTGTGKDYKYEFTEKQHKQLARSLKKVKGLWALSGYDSELYQKLFKGFFCSMGPDRATNLGKKCRKREMLWTNYDPQLYKSLKLF
jgi:DNA adenine methylase